MAARWRALDVAPSLVDKAKELWAKVASRRAGTAVPAPLPEQAPVEIRLPAIERRLLHLEEEAASSFEVVAAIAQQHSQFAQQHSELVSVIDALSSRIRGLLWVAGALALASLVLFLLVLTRS